MKRFTNILAQIAGFGVSGIAVFGHVIPPKYQPHVIAGVSALQAVVGVLAHQYNPDGTPAQVPYIPPSKPEPLK